MASTNDDRDHDSMSDIEMTQNDRPEQVKKAVAFDEEASRQESAEESLLSRQRWLHHSRRSRTKLEEVTVESRTFRHAHIVRRPRALQYFKPIEGTTTPPNQNLTKRISNNSTESGGEREERSTDNLLKQLGRLDLFVDLIWVGIIANLSHSFSEQAFTDSGVGIGAAVFEFVLLFIPIWRLWDYLRTFGSNYFNDDIFQRQFLCWILILCVLYGINSPNAYTPNDEPNSLSILIGIYLVARASFVLAHVAQSLFLPFVRRLVLFETCATIITSSFWIGAIWAPYPTKIVLLVIGNALEHPLGLILASPIGDRLITGGYKRFIHVDHYVERYEGFFIIILGEGVFRLIEGSPSGYGINGKTGTCLAALMVYYVLHWLYFNGDQTKEFVHALRRTWWKPMIWQFLHVTMFGSLLILAASILFLIKTTENPTAEITARETSAEASSPEAEHKYIRYALWSASVTLALVISCMTSIALLNRPLDKPKTLLVNSRWVRLTPRIPGMAAIMCLPLFKSVTGAGTWCGAAVVTLYIIFFWEWVAGLERDFKFFEGKDE